MPNASKYIVDVNKISKPGNIGTGGIFIGTGSGNRESLYAVRGTGSGAVVIYDKVYYELSVNDISGLEPNAQTVTFTYTSKRTHGNLTDIDTLSINPTTSSITANQSTASTKTTTVTVNQALTANGTNTGNSVTVTITQNKDYPTGITLSISPNSTIPAKGGTITSALTNYTYSVKANYKSGNSNVDITNDSNCTITADTASVTASSKGTTESSQTDVGNIKFTATYTCNGVTKTSQVTVTIKQDLNRVESYANPTFTLSPGNTTLPASGGSVTGSVSGVQQVRTWSSEATDTISISSPSVAWTSQTINCNSRGTTTGDTTTLGTTTASVTANGKSTNKSYVVYQEANAITSYDNPTFTLSPGNTTLPASGGSVTGSVSGVQQGRHFTSTASDTINISSPSVAWTSQTINCNSRGTTIGDTLTLGTTYATVTANGKSTSNNYTVYQQANAITSYDSPVGLTVSCSDIPAGGGTVTATTGGSVTQTRHYTSTSTDSISVTPTITWSPTQTASTTTLGTTIKERTKITTLTANYSANGKSNSTSVDVYQEANSITSYGYPTFTLSPGNTTLPASGGSVTQSLSTVYQSRSYTSTASDTITLTAGASTNGYSVAWTSQTISCGSRGTTTGNTSTLGTTTANVTSTNGKSNSTSVNVYQEANAITSYDNPTFTLSPGNTTLPASGGSVTGSISNAQQGRHFTSTASDTITLTAGASTNGYSVAWTSQTISCGSRGTTMGDTSTLGITQATITSTNGGYATKNYTVYQEENYITSYDNPTFTLSPGNTTLPASGGSVTGSVSGVQQGRHFTSTASDTININSPTVAWTSQIIDCNSRGTTIGDTLTLGTTTAIVTANGKSASKNYTVYQEANAITSYDNPTFTLSPGNMTLPASGGSVTGSVSGVQQVRHYTSTASDTINISSPTVAWTSQTINCNSRGTTTGSTSTLGTTYATVTANGKSTSNNYTVYQEANDITSYDNPTFTLSPGNTTLPASGGSVTGSVSGVQQGRHYTSTASDTINISSPTVEWTSQTISCESRGTTTGDTLTLGTTYATVTANGKSTSNNYTVYQAANAITSYDNPTFTLSPGNTTLPASGGSVTGSVSGVQQVRHYTSTASDTINISSPTVEWTSQTISCNSRGATTGDTLTLGTTYATVTANGKSASNNYTVYQEANAIVDYEESDGDYQTSISLSNNTLSAAGGTATVNASAWHTHYSYALYTSGYRVGPTSSTVYDTADVTLENVQATSTAFTYSNGTLSHRNMGTSQTTDSCTIRVRNASDTATTDTVSTGNITNAVEDNDYESYNSNYQASVSLSNNTMSAAGGTARINASAWHTHYYYYLLSSGSYLGPYSKTVYDTATVTLENVKATSRAFTRSRTTLTHRDMGTSQTTDSCTIRVRNASDTATTDTVSTGNITNTIEDYSYSGYNADYQVSLSFSNNTMSAAGGTATVNASAWHTNYYYYLFSSGSYTGPYSGTVYDTATVTLESITPTSTAFTYSNGTLSHRDMKTNQTTDSCRVRVRNASNTATTTYDNFSITNGVAYYQETDSNWGVSIVIGDGITAGASSANVSASAWHTHTTTPVLDSGQYGTSVITTVADRATVTKYSGANRFTYTDGGLGSGGTLNHATMGITAATDTVTLQVKNASNTGTTGSSAVTVVNQVESTEWGTPVISGDLSNVSWNSNSHSQSFTWSATQTFEDTFSSGEKNSGYAAINNMSAVRYSGNSNFTVSPTGTTSYILTSTISVPANTGTTSRSAVINVRAGGQGSKTGTVTFTITQDGQSAPATKTIYVTNETSYDAYLTYEWANLPSGSMSMPGDPDAGETLTGYISGSDLPNAITQIAGDFYHSTFSTLYARGSGGASGTIVMSKISGSSAYLGNGSITFNTGTTAAQITFSTS